MEKKENHAINKLWNKLRKKRKQAKNLFKNY